MLPQNGIQYTFSCGANHILTLKVQRVSNYVISIRRRKREGCCDLIQHYLLDNPTNKTLELNHDNSITLKQKSPWSKLSMKNITHFSLTSLQYLMMSIHCSFACFSSCFLLLSTGILCWRRNILLEFAAGFCSWLVPFLLAPHALQTVLSQEFSKVQVGQDHCTSKLFKP